MKSNRMFKTNGTTFACICTYLSNCLFICLSVNPSFPSICLPVFLSIRPRKFQEIFMAYGRCFANMQYRFEHSMQKPFQRLYFMKAENVPFENQVLYF